MKYSRKIHIALCVAAIISAASMLFNNSNTRLFISLGLTTTMFCYPYVANKE